MRYADDIVVGFEHEEEAKRFLAELRQRMEKFALSLHPDKTRLIEFGRSAAERRARRGLGKPETFNFLGFTHISGRSRQGGFQLKRKTRRDRMRAKLREIKEDAAAAHARLHSATGPVVGPSGTGVLPTITRFRPTLRAWVPFGTTSRTYGAARYSAAANGTAPRGNELPASPRSSCLLRASFIRGQTHALPSLTQGGSPVRKSRSPGSVRGYPGNRYPYRDQAFCHDPELPVSLLRSGRSTPCPLQPKLGRVVGGWE